eukprot:2587680-Amphidinium_carterae.1
MAADGQAASALPAVSAGDFLLPAQQPQQQQQPPQQELATAAAAAPQVPLQQSAAGSSRYTAEEWQAWWDSQAGDRSWRNQGWWQGDNGRWQHPSQAAAAASRPMPEQQSGQPLSSDSVEGRDAASRPMPERESWYPSTGQGLTGVPGVTVRQEAKEVSDPPLWPGWANYRLWRKAVVRWDGATDIPVHKRAYRLLNKFDYPMQMHFEHLDENLLASKSYLTLMLSVLDVLSGEKEEDQLRRALTGALMSWKREKHESLTQYVARREQQCLEAQKHNVVLPSLVKGFLLLEGAGLSLQSQANLRTLCGGQLQEEQVTRALRTLDVSTGDKDHRATAFVSDDVFAAGDGEESTTSSTMAAEILAELETMDLDEAEAAEVFAALERERQAPRKSWSAN